MKTNKNSKLQKSKEIRDLEISKNLKLKDLKQITGGSGTSTIPLSKK